MPFAVALDAGTGGAKCAVFDLDGRLRALRREAWDYDVRTDPEASFVRTYAFDPDSFWQILCRCARGALADLNASADDVVGVATTSQREACVFLDAAGKEIYAGPNLDARGFMEGLEVLTDVGAERLYEITGRASPFIFAIARYLWFRKHDGRPVERILMMNDWMTYRLCGIAVAEPSNATESMLFDFRARRWSEEILDRYGIPASLLPPIYEAGQRVGTIEAVAARETGLPLGTMVFIGGADTQCALLGVAAVEEGDVAVVLGTTAPVQAVTAAPLLDPAANLWAGCHVVPDRWVIEANLGGTGDAYEWLLDLLVPLGDDRYERADALARQRGTQGALAYLGPRIFDLTKLRPDMPGGIFFPFPMLQLRPDAGDLLRACLESIAFAVRGNLTQIEAVTGRRTQRLLATGGMTRNRLLVQMLADVTGIPLRCGAEPEGAALGCAILSAVGAGAYPDVNEAAGRMCHAIDVDPNPERREEYGVAFAKWVEVYDSLDKLSIQCTAS